MKGYTRIPNEILEKLSLTHLSGNEWKILILVIRKTYGFSKVEDRISLSQFQKLTGLSRPNVKKAINKLVAKQLLVVKTLPPINVYAINTSYSMWTSSEITTSSKINNLLVAKSLPTKDIYTKEKNENFLKNPILLKKEELNLSPQERAEHIMALTELSRQEDARRDKKRYG